MADWPFATGGGGGTNPGGGGGGTMFCIKGNAGGAEIGTLVWAFGWPKPARAAKSAPGSCCVWVVGKAGKAADGGLV